MTTGPRVVLLPADDYGCGRYRLVWPGNHLRRTGHDVIVNRYRRQHEVQIRVQNRPGPHGRWVVAGVEPVEADVVVFQRPNTPRLVSVIEHIRKQGVKVVVEVDDALWAVPRKNVSWKMYNADPQFGPHWKWLDRAGQAADLVTVSTPELGRHFEPYGPVAVLPNYLPSHFLGHGRAKLDVGPDPGFVSVGWAASLLTHPGDPDVLDGRLPGILRGANAGFLSVGGVERECRAFGFTDEDIEDRTASFTGEIPMKEWIENLSALDVSLVPLADTGFNHGKSWLKAIESAAAGAVPVLSPTPDNLRAAERGIGVVARTGQKWDRRIRRLIGDHGYRYEVACRGLEALEDLTIEKNSWRWMEAWTSVMG